MTTMWSVGNGRLVTKDGLVDDGLVVVTGSSIFYAGSRREGPLTWSEVEPDVDAEGGYICPGFIDLYVHGGGGADAMAGSDDAMVTSDAALTRWYMWSM